MPEAEVVEGRLVARGERVGGECHLVDSGEQLLGEWVDVSWGGGMDVCVCVCVNIWRGEALSSICTLLSICMHPNPASIL